jgi:hypothetical protein
MLRDLDKCHYTLKAINGWPYESLGILFYVLSSVVMREIENGTTKALGYHIDCFDDRKLYHLHKVKFRNKTGNIICQLSLSKQQKNKTRGISACQSRY